MLAAFLAAGLAIGLICGRWCSFVAMLVTSPPLAVAGYALGRAFGWTQTPALVLGGLAVALTQVSFLAGVAVRVTARPGSKQGSKDMFGRRSVSSESANR